MRQKVKQQLLDIIISMQELHGQCTTLSESALLSAMQDCQEAAMAIGEMLGDEAGELIPLLEQYCEEAYYVAQAAGGETNDLSKMDAVVVQLRSGLEAIQGVYQVVFFPYKAEMWDSLESVWQACQADPRCQAVVVPIPYFSMDQVEHKWVACYDGDRFPAEVPIVPYEEYVLSQELPEVAYVHNPYDNANLVTSVHPAYYSAELKKYVDKLVYIPYYVTTGFISKEHLALPLYHHMDYMVVQSEYFKSGCKQMIYYDKVLPLGSPKLDRVIRMCKEKPDMPSEWAAVLVGNKLLMLNTSLNCLLQQGERYLQKLGNLFGWLKEHGGVKIVWRPHPLLVSTMRSMRPQLLAMYEDLVEEFLKAGLGVLDTTPDITVTVALVDGYIGEEPTSIVNLFGAAGKPLFILNSWMTECSASQDVKRFRIGDMCYAKGKWWLTTGGCNGLFVLGDNWSDIGFAGRVEGQPKWYGAYGCLGTDGRDVFLSPVVAKAPAVYCSDGQFRAMAENCERGFLHQRHVIVYKDSVFYLPGLGEGIEEFHKNTGKWTTHEACIAALKAGVAAEKLEGTASTQAYAQEGNILWIVTMYSNRVLCFYMDNGSYQVLEVGEPDWRYVSVLAANGKLWLAEAEQGNILCYDVISGVATVLDRPQEVSLRGNIAFGTLVDAGEWIVAMPVFANTSVRIHKVTGKSEVWLSELWQEADKPQEDYIPEVHGSVGFCKQVEKHLWVQRTYDDALIDIDLETGKYEVQYPRLSDAGWEAFMDGQDGFERPDKDFYAFARRESRWFPVERFMTDLVSGHLEAVVPKQLEALSEFAVNLDGTCGEKVHEFLMKVLEQGEEAL